MVNLKSVCWVYIAIGGENKTDYFTNSDRAERQNTYVFRGLKCDMSVNEVTSALHMQNEDVNKVYRIGGKQQVAVGVPDNSPKLYLVICSGRNTVAEHQPNQRGTLHPRALWDARE